VKLLKNKETGKRKGFGFIEMPEKNLTKAAIKALNDKRNLRKVDRDLLESVEKEQEGLGNSERPRLGDSLDEKRSARMARSLLQRKT